jgi:hypothetical protein
MVSSLFIDEFVEASNSIDEVYGESFWLLPRKRAADPNGPDIPDPSRVEREFVGVFLDPQVKPDMPESYDLRADRRPGVSAGAPRIDIMPEVISSGLVVMAQDLVRCIGTGKIWRVTSVFTTKAAITRCFVNLIGS